MQRPGCANARLSRTQALQEPVRHEKPLEWFFPQRVVWPTLAGLPGNQRNMKNTVNNPVTADLLVHQLDQLGVKPGDLLLVHTAFSAMGPVVGGPLGFIDALMQAVGPGGTLMMPSMADDDGLFDARHTPCRSMGVVADTFRTLPSVQRSDNPHAFAAIGPLSEVLLAPHPVTVPHGLDSPAGRAIALGGKVLLAGVGHDANTTVHVAENEMRVRYGIEAHSTVLVHGEPVELRYREIDHCCQGFDRVGQLLSQRHQQRAGPLGHGTAVLAPSRHVFKAACDLLGRNPEALLCDSGSCKDCDAARRGYEPPPAGATTFVGTRDSADLHRDNGTVVQADQQQDTSLGDLSRA